MRFLKRWLPFSVLCLILCAVGGSAAAEHLVVLHCNDTHGHLFSVDGSTELGSNGGAARMATLVRQAREENPGQVLLLHAGDLLSRGDRLTTATGGRAVFDVLDAVGFDVVVPGNGDFYDGVEHLLSLERSSKPKFVLANITYKRWTRELFAPHTIVERGGVRVGVLGLGFIHEDHSSSKPLALEEPITAARRVVPELRPKVDVLIALTHIGFPEDFLLAEAIPELDLIVGGHTHTRLDPPVAVPRRNGQGDVYVVQAFEHGAFLGRVDIDLERRDGALKVTRIRGKLLPCDETVQPDPVLEATLERRLESIRKPAERVKPEAAAVP